MKELIKAHRRYKRNNIVLILAVLAILMAIVTFNASCKLPHYPYRQTYQEPLNEVYNDNAGQYDYERWFPVNDKMNCEK